MRTQLERSLRDLRMLLAEAAGRVENAVRSSLEALLNRGFRAFSTGSA